MAHQIYKVHWRGIDIQVGYEVESCCSSVSHLEIRSINPPSARLPMTETGYRSHFHQAGMIENDYGGDVVAFITQWLNAEAKSKKWEKYVKISRQLEFF